NLAQELDAVHPRHIQIEEHYPPPLRNVVRAQHLEGFDTVARDEERVRDVMLRERPLHVHHVHLVVLDEQDVELLAHSARFLSCFGHVNLKVAPPPGADSSDTRPPRASMIFLTTERPIPVPSTLSRAASV